MEKNGIAVSRAIFPKSIPTFYCRNRQKLHKALIAFKEQLILLLSEKRVPLEADRPTKCYQQCA